MQAICSTCLSQNRSLKSLSLLRKDINLEWLQLDFMSPSSELCWECVEQLRRADRFRRRAVEAQNALETVQQLCSDQSPNPLRTLSTLTVSETCQDNCTEWDTPHILKKIKQNKHISLSTGQSIQRKIKKCQIDVVKADHLETIPDIEQKIKHMLGKLMSSQSHDNIKKKYVKLFSILEVTEPHLDSVEPNMDHDEPELIETEMEHDDQDSIEPSMADDDQDSIELIPDNDEPQTKKKHLSYDMDPDYNIMEPIIDIMEPISEITESVIDVDEPVVNMASIDNGCDKANVSYDSNQTKGWPVLTVGDPNINLTKTPATNKINVLSNNVSAEKTNMCTKRKQQKRLLILKAIKTPGGAKFSQVTQTSMVPQKAQDARLQTAINKSMTFGAIRDGKVVFMKPVKLSEINKNTLIANANTRSQLIKSPSNILLPCRIAPKSYESSAKDQMVKSKSGKKSEHADVPYKVRHLSVEEVLKLRDVARNEPEYAMSPFKCESCIQVFSTDEDCNKHMQLNHTESSGPFICSICSTRFKRERSLKWHYKAHRIAYKCSQCVFRHHSEQAIAKHCQDMHQGIPCQFCHVHCSSQRQLTEHILEQHMSRKELRFYRPSPPAPPADTPPLRLRGHREVVASVSRVIDPASRQRAVTRPVPVLK